MIEVFLDQGILGYDGIRLPKVCNVSFKEIINMILHIAFRRVLKFIC